MDDMKLPPYPEYKDSGLPWLGQVPTHWNLLRAKYLMREMDRQSKDESGTLLSVSQYSGVTKRRSREGSEDPDTRSSSLVGYKVAKPGNLVSNIMLAWNGSLGIAPIEGVVSPAYCVYRICIGEPWFFHHLLRSPAYKAEIKRRSRGVVDSRLRLYTDDFFRIPMLLPSLEEQQAIVRFVRDLDGHVRSFIRNRRRLIEVLNEQKQAIINRAVTRGLDPNTPLKPSGIDWLGDIPEHWEATTLGRLVRTFKTGPFGSIMHQSDYITGGIPLINPVHMSGGRITPDKNCTVDDSTFNRLREYALAEGDIVFSRRGELGRCALVRAAEADWLIGTGSIRARLLPDAVDPSYLIAALQGRWVYDYLSLMSVGATMQSLNTGILSRVPLPLPPIGEQRQIPLFIEGKSARVIEAIDKAQREIALIREYRTRLISDVITGKVDVRHLAPPAGSEDLEESAEALLPLEEDIPADMMDDEEPIHEVD